MKFIQKLENICAIGLIIFFFLPWININGMIPMSGYEIPDKLKQLNNFSGQLANAINGNNGHKSVNLSMYFFYTVYLIPLLSFFTVIRAAVGANVNRISFFSGIIPFFILAYAAYLQGPSIFRDMQIGAWLTLLTAFTMLLSLAGIIRMPIIQDNKN